MHLLTKKKINNRSKIKTSSTRRKNNKKSTTMTNPITIYHRIDFKIATFLFSSFSQEKKMKKKRGFPFCNNDKRGKKRINEENLRICKLLKKKFEASDALETEEAQKLP